MWPKRYRENERGEKGQNLHSLPFQASHKKQKNLLRFPNLISGHVWYGECECVCVWPCAREERRKKAFNLEGGPQRPTYFQGPFPRPKKTLFPLASPN